MRLHTPGPWVVTANSDDQLFIGPHGIHVAEVCSNWPHPATADATLIASAPDMLTTLRAARSMIVAYESLPPWTRSDTMKQLYNMLTEAIEGAEK